jgi:hypothetical protein
MNHDEERRRLSVALYAPSVAQNDALFSSGDFLKILPVSELACYGGGG